VNSLVLPLAAIAFFAFAYRVSNQLLGVIALPAQPFDGGASPSS